MGEIGRGGAAGAEPRSRGEGRGWEPSSARAHSRRAPPRSCAGKLRPLGRGQPKVRLKISETRSS